MDMNVVQTMISAMGFPIFVAVFMLFKSSRDSADLKAAVGELTTAIKVLAAKNEGSGNP